MSIIKKLKKSPSLIPLIIYHLVILVIVLVNLPINQWFIGWDAISPELNFSINFRRGIFAAWQENYGLGSLTGHGFAATLPHTSFIWLLSLFIPTHVVRASFTFIMLYLGGLGLFILSKYLLKQLNNYKKSLSPQLLSWIALTGALFYVLNLGTAQIFYLQLEAFIVQFAALPWIFWILFKIFKTQKTKWYWWFFLINVISSTQGFIPSLFVAFALCLATTMLGLILFTPKKYPAIKTSLMIVILMLAAHAYWFLPFVYYAFTHNQIYLQAYNNLLTTQGFIFKSQAFGRVSDTALLKSFFLDSYQFGEYVFEPWLEHLRFFSTRMVGYILFGLTTLGTVFSWIKKDKITRSLGMSAIFSFAILTTNTIPFSWLSELLRKFSPVFAQSFRIAFTKVGIINSMMYAVFLTIGIFHLLSLTKKVKTELLNYSAVFLLLIGTIWYGWPHLTGNTLYDRLTLQIPDAYLEVIEHFKGQPDSRIADLPVDCNEGWYTYDWGYFGSGFYWYGIPQPIMSRSFDVWNNNNEQYYWELIYALRNQRFDLVDSIFDKYHISWIIVDPNLKHCRHQKGFDYQKELFNYFDSSDDYSLEGEFLTDQINQIKIYKYKDLGGYLKAYSDLPTHETGGWVHQDLGFSQLNNYISNNQNSNIAYPFATLFSQRSQLNDTQKIKIEKNNTKLVFKLPISEEWSNQQLALANIRNTSAAIPIKLEFNQLGQSTNISLTFSLPIIQLNDQILLNEEKTILLGTVPYKSTKLTPIVNKFEVKNNESIFRADLNNQVVILNDLQKTIFKWESDDVLDFQEFISKPRSIELPTLTQSSQLLVKFPIIEGTNLSYLPSGQEFVDLLNLTSCSSLPETKNLEYETPTAENAYTRMISEKTANCAILDLSNLDTNQGYLLEIISRHVSGQPLSLSINDSSGVRYLSLPLSTSQSTSTERYVLPPSKIANENGYQLLFKNISHSSQETVNDILGVELIPIPFEILNHLQLIKNDRINQEITQLKLESSHLNETLYFASAKNSNPYYLTLSQSFDQGWIAILKNNPFKKLNHFRHNSWANAWEIPAGENEIIIFYWPQLLIFSGYIFLLSTLIYLTNRLVLIKKKPSKSKSLKTKTKQRLHGK